MKSVILVLCAMSGVAMASPAYPFDELLRRSETVFIGELGKHDATSLTFTVRHTLRGKPAARFDFDAVNGELPKGVTQYVVISQGDDVGGKPTAKATLGQGIIGQVSFRGWIVLPVVNGEVIGAMLMGKTMATVKLADVAGIVAGSPYKPKG